MNKLREIRLRKKLTLEQVAKAADTSIQQVQRLEKSHRRLTQDWIRRLSIALDATPSEIVPEFASAEYPADVQDLIENYLNATKEAQEAVLKMVRQLSKSAK